MRTSGPFLPSGRSAASTGHRVPSAVDAEQARIRLVASWVPTDTVAVSSGGPPSSRSAGSTTKITSTSLT